VDTFNKIRGNLGKIAVNRIDLVQRGVFNNDSSPLSLIKMFFSSQKPSQATKFNMKEKKEKKAARGKQYVEESKIFNQKKQMLKEGGIGVMKHATTTNVIDRIQPKNSTPTKAAPFVARNNVEDSIDVDTDSDVEDSDGQRFNSSNPKDKKNNSESRDDVF
jgi:hypothetical protein